MQAVMGTGADRVMVSPNSTVTPDSSTHCGIARPYCAEASAPAPLRRSRRVEYRWFSSRPPAAPSRSSRLFSLARYSRHLAACASASIRLTQRFGWELPPGVTLVEDIVMVMKRRDLFKVAVMA